jgi:hypothetical protein
MEIENEQSAIFLQLIIQHQQLAMMGLGMIPNPMDNTIINDLEYAKMAIDTIEVLKEKTKGNLLDYEEQFMDQILQQLKDKYSEVESAKPSNIIIP